jgi:protein SCO1/2
MFLEPIFVVLVAAVLWRQSCVELCRLDAWLRHARAAAAGITLVALAVAGLFWFAAAERAAAAVVPPFPGDRIRVKLPVPATGLVDQKEKTFRFADLRGQVVLVTGVYASCTTACPEIFKELQAVLAELTPAERAGLRVVALTLNPEYETAALMDAIADGRGFVYPEFRYAGAAQPPVQHALLSDLQFAAVRNPVTRQIDHANLLLLLDRHGDIAFRFNLDPRHRAWLRAALRQLLQEPHGAPGPS